MSDDSNKIIIDESWKAQVQREREQISEPEQPEGVDDEGMLNPDDIDPASFLGLLSTMAAQGMMALGLIGPPGQEEVYVDVEQAQVILNSLAMLKVKTAGNLDETEALHLDEVITELGQVLAMRHQQIEQAAIEQAGIDPTNLKVDE